MSTVFPCGHSCALVHAPVSLSKTFVFWASAHLSSDPVPSLATPGQAAGGGWQAAGWSFQSYNPQAETIGVLMGNIEALSRPKMGLPSVPFGMKEAKT